MIVAKIKKNKRNKNMVLPYTGKTGSSRKNLETILASNIMTQ